MHSVLLWHGAFGVLLVLASGAQLPRGGSPQAEDDVATTLATNIDVVQQDPSKTTQTEAPAGGRPDTRPSQPANGGSGPWLTGVYESMMEQINNMMEAVSGMLGNGPLIGEGDMFLCRIVSDDTFTNVSVSMNGNTRQYSVKTPELRNCTRALGCANAQLMDCLQRLDPKPTNSSTATGQPAGDEGAAGTASESSTTSPGIAASTNQASTTQATP